MTFHFRRACQSYSSPLVHIFKKRSFKSVKFPGESLEDISSPSLAHGIHVFHSPDEVGIVAKLSECIASRGGNILSADVFVPEKENVFYSRSEFVFDPAEWPRTQMDEDFSKIAKKFNAMRSVVRVPSLDPKYKIAVFASKQDHCLVDVLHGWQSRRLPVDIRAVIRKFLKKLREGYYQYSPWLVAVFQGGNPAKQAFDAGVKLIGATSHFVTEDLDEGPIIEQMVERVSHRDNLRTFVQKFEDVEKRCLAKAIRSYCELRVLPYVKNKTVVF